jgi:hypothetical protein
MEKSFLPPVSRQDAGSRQSRPQTAPPPAKKNFFTFFEKVLDKVF